MKSAVQYGDAVEANVLVLEVRGVKSTRYLILWYDDLIHNDDSERRQRNKKKSSSSCPFVFVLISRYTNRHVIQTSPNHHAFNLFTRQEWAHLHCLGILWQWQRRVMFSLCLKKYMSTWHITRRNSINNINIRQRVDHSDYQKARGLRNTWGKGWTRIFIRSRTMRTSYC